MTIQEAIKNRHSVRSYQAREIDAATVLTLKEEIEKCNHEGDLSIQLITNDSSVFKGLMAHYGGFRGVSNYIALIGMSLIHISALGDIVEIIIGCKDIVVHQIWAMGYFHHEVTVDVYKRQA